MKPGDLRVARNGKGEALFEVHLWPQTTELPRTCSSICADREPVETLSPAWAHPGDGDAIGQRLAAPKRGATTGKSKGRVLYLVERTPLKNSYRVGAVALLSLRHGGRVIELYRVCFNDNVTSYERDYHSVELVRCAVALAEAANARLHMLVPPGRTAGEMRLAYNFTSATKDEFGRTWVVR